MAMSESAEARDVRVAPDTRARLDGFLNWELYAIETTWLKPIEEMQHYADAHLSHQVNLERRGILFAAGPLFEADAPRFPPKSGLIVIRAASFEDADAIAASDPMHQAGMRSYTIRRWIINEGSLSITVNMSNKTMVLS
jgi:hypothetical protein